MTEAQCERVQELPREPQVARHAIARVSAHRQADRGEVHANLVRAAGLEPDLEERVLGELLDELEMRDRLSGLVRVERATGALPPVASDGSVDAPGARLRPAAREREVPSFDLAVADRVLERAVRVLRARDDEQPGRVAVEPVDDTWPVRVVSPERCEREELWQQRLAPRPRAGVHGDTRRLVEDDEVLVLVDEWHRYDSDLDLGLAYLGERHLDLRPCFQPIALLPSGAVDEDRPRREQSLGKRAGADLGT